MLKRVGVQEVFLPKRFPDDPGCRSASVDWSQDASLTIPAADLAVMNAADWYREPGAKAWAVANKHFDVLFFVLQVELLASIARNFNGIALWRAFGLAGRMSYSGLLQSFVAGRQGACAQDGAALGVGYCLSASRRGGGRVSPGPGNPSAFGHARYDHR